MNAPGEGSNEIDRDRHWEELLRRRRERDRRLAEEAERGEGPFGAPPAAGEGAPEGESILERMRQAETAGPNPVQRREQEEEREALQNRARAQRFIAGLALLLALIGAGWLLLRSPSYEVTASFENASQLVEGNEVVIAGTRVGSIQSIELGEHGEAVVSFSVEEAHAPLRRGTTATVRNLSLSGIANRQIELKPPPEGIAGAEIPNGGTLTREETVSAVDLDHLFNTLDDETVADLKKVIRGFELSYEGVGKQANEGFRYLNPFLWTSRRLFAELARDERALEGLLVGGAKLTGALAARRDDVSALIANIEESMGALGRQRSSLAAAIADLPDFMRSFNTTAVNLRATLDDLDPLVEASKPVAIRLQPFFAELRGAAANLVPTIRDLDLAAKRPGAANDLIELTRLQSPLTRIAAGPVRRNGSQRAGAFPESVRSLEDSLPQLAFFRAYTPELTGWFNDFGPTSGVFDANGGISRIAVTFNSFALSPNGLPVIDLTDPLFGADGALQQAGLMTLGNRSRCPGSNERPAPDGSNPFTDGGNLNCDPTQIPPGP